MYCLGIESTAHTFGAGIVSFDGKILANIKDTFTTEKGGMIPSDVAKHHERVKDTVVAEALKKAGLALADLSLISYSHGPGLSPSLLVGLKKAKALAKEAKLPIIGDRKSVV